MMNSRKAQKSVYGGFTLVEMAVALVIVGLLLGGMTLPLVKLQEQATYNNTKQQLGEIREALIGYGMSHGYLPCPAKSYLDGSEDRDASTGACNQRMGFLPWAEIGAAKLDSWGHLYRYSVTPAFSNSATKISLTTSGDITVQNRDSSGNLGNISNIPLVVISFGRSAAWAYADSGAQIANSSLTNSDEDTNGNGTSTSFITREISDNTASTGGEFDDLVAWIPASLYINRMVSASQLP
jgi:prepilin-type N-terminal cleavage/methylation domain-containing protein